MQIPFIKSPPLTYGNGFFLKKKGIIIHFLNGFSTKNSKILNDPTFNQFISIPFTIKKINKKFHS
jgi:hypothetical protein